MDNLSRFLTEVAWGLDEQAGALSDDGATAIPVTGAALRDYACQMRAVAEATAPDGSVAWTGIDAEIGVDLQLEPEPLVRLVVGPEEMYELTQEIDVPFETAVSRAIRWAPAIQQAVGALCASQLRTVMEIDFPGAAGATTAPQGQRSAG
jgi:hypothetical protein